MDFNIFNSIDTGFWIKIGVLGAILFYAVFAFILFTQVRTMSQILHLSHGSSTLTTIAIINIVVSISLFLLTIAIL
jgi:hypothetical protein